MKDNYSRFWTENRIEMSSFLHTRNENGQKLRTVSLIDKIFLFLVNRGC